jgi:hypothetical protein
MLVLLLFHFFFPLSIFSIFTNNESEISLLYGIFIIYEKLIYLLTTA